MDIEDKSWRVSVYLSGGVESKFVVSYYVAVATLEIILSISPQASIGHVIHAMSNKASAKHTHCNSLERYSEGRSNTMKKG